MSYKKEIEFAKITARNAGIKILEIYEKGFSIFEKKNGDGLVTEADFLSNEYICSEIRRIFQYDGILSEENDDNLERLSKNRVWCIDPLDGTKDFILKNGEFAIHIGLIDKGKPVLGVVFLPVFNKMYYGEVKNNAFLDENGEIKVLNTSDIFDINKMVLIGSRNHREKLYVKLAKELVSKREIIHGSLGAKAGYILEKKADFMFYPNDKTKEWDICAPHAIINAAGGIATGLCGEPLFYNKRTIKNSHGILISNGKNHNGLIEKIRLAL